MNLTYLFHFETVKDEHEFLLKAKQRMDRVDLTKLLSLFDETKLFNIITDLDAINFIHNEVFKKHFFEGEYQDKFKTLNFPSTRKYEACIRSFNFDIIDVFVQDYVIYKQSPSTDLDTLYKHLADKIPCDSFNVETLKQHKHRGDRMVTEYVLERIRNNEPTFGAGVFEMPMGEMLFGVMENPDGTETIIPASEIMKKYPPHAKQPESLKCFFSTI